MTFSVSALLRATTIGLAAGLALTSCSSDDADPSSEDTPSQIELPEAPAATEQETTLAETLETDFEVTNATTLEDQWPDLVAMSSALSGTENPDACQQAGAEQYQLLLDAQPPSVLATFNTEAHLDEHASGETVTVFYANEDATTQQLHEVHQQTDAACIEEYESAVQHDVTETDVEDKTVEVHTWEVVATDQLTGRMVDVIDDDVLVRYAAAYPPQVIVEDLDDDAAKAFNDAATERALDIFAAATAQ